uniref:PP2C family protein-serine/threonine phosphatase n=1 Tax=Pseudonocardia nigra TaxID=1921578 RepID=UPI001C5F926B
LWVPMLDGTERAGLLRIGLDTGVVDDETLRRRLWSLSGLMGHIVMTKMAYSEHLRRLRGAGRMSAASTLMWQLLPPRTFATREVVVTALLEPCERVAGDGYDYVVDDHEVDVAVFDGVGHDLKATHLTGLALTAIRNARRAGVSDLVALAGHADELLAAGEAGRAQFATAVLARLDTRTGVLEYLLAGHPAPLLFRQGHLVRELGCAPRLPLGVVEAGVDGRFTVREQLEPGDRVLLYTDGVTEARNADGEFFSEQRLVDFTERAELDGLPAPETLRRLAAAVLAHQGGHLQDDATLLMIDWSSDGPRRLLPTLS